MRTLLRGAVLAASVVAAGAALAGPERLWLVQSGSAAGNAGAMQMQEQLVNELKRIGVDYPAGQVMTLDQINRLNALFTEKGDEPSMRDEAKQILGMQ